MSKNKKRNDFVVEMQHGKKSAIKEARNLNKLIVEYTDYFLHCGINPSLIPKQVSVPDLRDDPQLLGFQQLIDSTGFQLQTLLAQCDQQQTKTVLKKSDLMDMLDNKFVKPGNVMPDFALIKQANIARDNLLKRYEGLNITPPDYLVKEIAIPTQQEIDANTDPATFEKLNYTAKGALIQFNMLSEDLRKMQNEAVKVPFKDKEFTVNPTTPAECVASIKYYNAFHDHLINRLNVIGIPSQNMPKKLKVEDYNIEDENERSRLSTELKNLVKLIMVEFEPIRHGTLQIIFPVEQVNMWRSLGVKQSVIDENTPLDATLAAIVEREIVKQCGNHIKYVGTKAYGYRQGDQYLFHRYIMQPAPLLANTKNTKPQSEPKPAPVVVERKQPPAPQPKKPKRRIIIEETREIAMISTSATSITSNNNPIATIEDEYSNKLEAVKKYVNDTYTQIVLDRAEIERNVNTAYEYVDNHLRLGDRAQYEFAEDDSLLKMLETQKSALEKLLPITATDEEMIAAKTALQTQYQAFKTTCESIKAKLMSYGQRLSQTEEQIKTDLIAAEKAAKNKVNDDDDDVTANNSATNNNEADDDNNEVSTVTAPSDFIALERKSATNSYHFIGMNLNNSTNQPKKPKNKKNPQQKGNASYINPLALDLISSNIEKSLNTIDTLYDKYTKHCKANNKQGVFDVTSAIAMIDLEGLALNVCEIIAKFQQQSGLSLFEKAEDAATSRHVSKYCFHWFIFKMENSTNKTDYNMLDFIQFIRTDVKKALFSLMHGKGEYKIPATHPELEKTRKALTTQNATTPDIAVLNARFTALVSFMETILQEHHKQEATSIQKHERAYALSFLLALVGLSVKNAIEINKDNKAYHLNVSYLPQLTALGDDETKISALLEKLEMTEVKKLLIEICNEKSHENKNTWTNFKPLQNKLTLILANFIIHKAEGLRKDCFTVPEPKLPPQAVYTPSFAVRAIVLKEEFSQSQNKLLFNRFAQNLVFLNISFALDCISAGNNSMAAQAIEHVLAGNNMECFKDQYLYGKSRQLFDRVENLLVDVHETQSNKLTLRK